MLLTRDLDRHIAEGDGLAEGVAEASARGPADELFGAINCFAAMEGREAFDRERGKAPPDSRRLDLDQGVTPDERTFVKTDGEAKPRLIWIIVGTNVARPIEIALLHAAAVDGAVAGIDDTFSSARFGGREVLTSGFTVSSDARSVLDLSIASSGGVVAGVVRGAKDEPISNGTVVLIPPNRENLNLYRTASTDQFGVFSIAGVPPGEYSVLAWTEARGKAYLDPVFLKAVENQAAKVVVQRGFTNTINVRAISP